MDRSRCDSLTGSVFSVTCCTTGCKLDTHRRQPDQRKKEPCWGKSLICVGARGLSSR